ncbi:MAG: symmetrical bis(5'-nucleosyl)-tetraphosphatase [Sinobacteraceae bacterium]|nr:symmetrical bis(5'-nucleosyl)-tetraphosphatase [Nevskiaceae bacterium]
MARIAIGDVQGCLTELHALLDRLKFSADRDELWFVGDLVNRGPQSLGVLRFVRALGSNARVVLGNHDLHLLAVAFGRHRELRKGDTLDEILQAKDRDSLLEWLLHCPLAECAAAAGPDGVDDLMVHAGVVPQWSVAEVLSLAAEVQQVLRERPEQLFAGMYGNKPDRWDETLQGLDRWRFVINTLTRLRYCREDGQIDLKMKGTPGSQSPGWRPWFELGTRRSSTARVIFGHWSTLGLRIEPKLLALDTGCVWGGALTAVCLDSGQLWQEACAGYREPG